MTSLVPLIDFAAPFNRSRLLRRFSTRLSLHRHSQREPTELTGCWAGGYFLSQVVVAEGNNRGSAYASDWGRRLHWRPSRSRPLGPRDSGSGSGQKAARRLVFS